MMRKNAKSIEKLVTSRPCLPKCWISWCPFWGSRHWDEGPRCMIWNMKKMLGEHSISEARQQHARPALTIQECMPGRMKSESGSWNRGISDPTTPAVYVAQANISTSKKTSVGTGKAWATARMKSEKTLFARKGQALEKVWAVLRVMIHAFS